jgi:hypothetical protein
MPGCRWIAPIVPDASKLYRIALSESSGEIGKDIDSVSRWQDTPILHISVAPPGLFFFLRSFPGGPFGHPRLAYKPAKHLTVAPSGAENRKKFDSLKSFKDRMKNQGDTISAHLLLAQSRPTRHNKP